MSALTARAETDRYRSYIADCAKNINEIMAHQFGGIYITDRLHPQATAPQDNRTGDEIAEDIIKRAGLTLRG